MWTRTVCCSIALVLGMVSSLVTADDAVTPPTQVSADASPLIGRWMGNVAGGPNGRELFVSLDIVAAPPGQTGVPTVKATLLQAGVIGQECSAVRIDGRSVSCTLDARGVPGTFDGTVSADGKKLDGLLALRAPGVEPIKLPFSIDRSSSAREVGGARAWTGSIAVAKRSIELVLVLADAGVAGGEWCGSIDIPEQGLLDCPLIVKRIASVVDGQPDQFSLRLPVGQDAVFTLSEDAATHGLSGEFRQGTFSTPIVFVPSESIAIAQTERAQTPKAPFPYETRDLEFRNLAQGHVLRGTLTIPVHAVGERVPVLVFSTGSGPQDRDETLFGHKPFAVLADALTRGGIATFRFDDRGTGASEGNFASATSSALATDLDSATMLMKTLPEIDPVRVGVLGHSEGATHAMQVAAWQRGAAGEKVPASPVVLLAPPGVTGRDILIHQHRLIGAATGFSAEALDATATAQASVLDAAARDASDAEMTQLVETLMRTQMVAAGIPVDEATLRGAVPGVVAELKGPWMREFIVLNPASLLAQVSGPVLAVWGSKDLQVDPEQNRPGLMAAAHEGLALETVVLPGLNHLFQPSQTGSPDEYAVIKITMDPAALALIVEWTRSKMLPDAADKKDPAKGTVAP
ncbi:MAG: alpha/beta hydrolase [Planctomycetota bacterium]|nr:alpha/beta hydrolase [Planctomycetota bacterium]